MLAAIMADGADLVDPARKDFHFGNIKARQRMIAQYALAGATGGLVIGTDQAAEALMGFFAKFGDGAADVLPLAGLTKRRVRAVAEHMGAPLELVFKVPTADLESEKPLRPDEEVYGVTYDEIDDFLEGRPVGERAPGDLENLLCQRAQTLPSSRAEQVISQNRVLIPWG